MVVAALEWWQPWWPWQLLFHLLHHFFVSAGAAVDALLKAFTITDG
jgi:hypothetical protein